MTHAARQPTVSALIRDTARRFRAAGLAYGHGTVAPADDAAWLVLHALGIRFEDARASARYRPSLPELRRVERLADRRIRERIPVAYLLREAWLGDFRFYVDRRVIVPRSFIAEILSDGIVPLLRGEVRRALDLCTGSGCLAILLALAFERAHVDALDLSRGALAVARRNVDAYGLGRRVRPLHSDLFGAVAGRRYDLIVSNPPYVDASAMAGLPEEYRREPRMALAAGRDGLKLVRRILREAAAHLRPHGLLVCEIGHNRAALERACPDLPFTWLETSAGDEYVFALERQQLPDLRGA